MKYNTSEKRKLSTRNINDLRGLKGKSVEVPLIQLTFPNYRPPGAGHSVHGTYRAKGNAWGRGRVR